jgi:hypothetical protein
MGPERKSKLDEIGFDFKRKMKAKMKAKANVKADEENWNLQLKKQSDYYTV